MRVPIEAFIGEDYEGDDLPFEVDLGSRVSLMVAIGHGDFVGERATVIRPAEGTYPMTAASDATFLPQPGEPPSGLTEQLLRGL